MARQDQKLKHIKNLRCSLTGSSGKDADEPGLSAVLKSIQQHMIYSETDPRGRITHVNPAFCALSGYEREELIGSFHNVVNSGTHDGEFWRDFWTTIRSGRPWHGEICNRTKDGSPYWVDSVILPLVGHDGKIARFVSIRHDITDRKRAENALSHMGRVVEHSANEVFVFDAQSLKFILVNRGARENLGYSASELSHLTPVDIKPEFDEERFRRTIAPLIQGEADTLSFHTLHQRKDGSNYPCDINLHYARNENPPIFLAFVQDITQRRQDEESMRRLALYDPLTGLANRAHFQQDLKSAFQDPDRPLHLYYLDLNRFKQINDTFGHAVGDEVLKVAAKRLGTVTTDARLVARLGGDEFVVLYEEIGSETVPVYVDRLLSALKQPMMIKGHYHQVDASIGVARYPEDTTSSEDLLQAADIAMFDAKKREIGHSLYDTNMKKRIETRQRISERLTLSLDQGTLAIAFQPFVDLTNNNLIGAEALLRWTDSELGTVPPTEILSVAQEYRMLRELGYWVLDATCKAIVAWENADFILPCPISVNVTAEQVEDGSVVRDLSYLFKTFGVRPDQIEVELTESGMMKAPEKAREVVSDLRRFGVKVAIDDFGTGYSSLARLMQLSVDKLKIDNSFVNGLANDNPKVQLIQATVALARGLGCSVIAEGIETESQANILRRLGCNAGQGYLFDQPLTAEEFSMRWLKKTGVYLDCEQACNFDPITG